MAFLSENDMAVNRPVEPEPVMLANEAYQLRCFLHMLISILIYPAAFQDVYGTIKIL